MAPAFDVPPDGAAELTALLERSGVDFQQERDRFSFVFASGGCRWQTVRDCREGTVLVYGIHPTAVPSPQRALALCSELNANVIRGGFFLREGHMVFRTARSLSSISTFRRGSPPRWNITPPP